MSIWQSEKEYIEDKNYIQIPNIWVTDDTTMSNKYVWNSATYNQYAFNLDLATLKDTVSGNSLTTVIPGTRYDTVNGVQTSFGSNVPTITEKGLRTVGAYSNYCLWSADKSKISLQNGATFSNGVFSILGSGDSYIKLSGTNFSLPTLTVGSQYYASLIDATGTGHFQSTWVREGGTFEQWVTNNVALSATPQNINTKITFAYGDHTSVYYRTTIIDSTPITLTFSYFMISNKKYYHPYLSIATTGGTATSVSEAGSADNGNKLSNIATNFPKLYEALNGKVESGVKQI